MTPLSCATLVTVLALACAPGRGRMADDARVGTSGQGRAVAPESVPDRRGRGVPSPARLQDEPVECLPDLPYADDHPRQRLDLYLPRQRARDVLPVIVFVHGGGWAHGDKAVGAAMLLSFVRGGDYAGVSVGYRLSADATWPAPLHDVKAAVRWVRAHAAEHGLDPERIAVWGSSAGGHLALMVGLTAGVPELEGEVGPHVGVRSDVRAVGNSFGVTELLALVGQPGPIDRAGPDAPEALLIGGPLLEHVERARDASPVCWVTADDPPVLTVHGTDDQVVPYDQALRLDAALRRAGVESFLVTVEGGAHGDFGTAADGRLAAFFARTLLDAPVTVSTEPIEAPPPPTSRRGR